MTYSTFFNGSAAFLSTPSNAALAFGTGDFTIEFWMNVNGASDNAGQHIVQNRNGTGNGFVLQYDRLNRRIFFQSDTAYSISSATGSILDSTWYHVAVTRSGSNTTLFLNGVAVGTQTLNEDLTATGPLFVSRRWVTDGALHYFNGFLSNLRLVKGTAVYTANFTPPTTPLTNITGTSVLLCQSATMVDNSSNAFTITTSTTAPLIYQIYPAGYTATGKANNLSTVSYPGFTTVLGLVTPDTRNTNSQLLPQSVTPSINIPTVIYYTGFSTVLGLVTPDTRNTSSQILPQSVTPSINIPTVIYYTGFANPNLARVSTFLLSGNDPVTGGTGTAAAVTTQSWYIG